MTQTVRERRRQPRLLSAALVSLGVHASAVSLVLLVRAWHPEDEVVPVSYSQDFAANHPNAALEIVDSGHELTDVLEYMAPKVAAFLL